MDTQKDKSNLNKKASGLLSTFKEHQVMRFDAAVKAKLANEQAVAITIEETNKLTDRASMLIEELWKKIGGKS